MTATPTEAELALAAALGWDDGEGKPTEVYLPRARALLRYLSTAEPPFTVARTSESGAFSDAAISLIALIVEAAGGRVTIPYDLLDERIELLVGGDTPIVDGWRVYQTRRSPRGDKL